MMVIRHLSSEVDLEAGISRHSMVVGLLEGGALEIPIDALTYGSLVGAFEQLFLDAESAVPDTNRSSVEPVPTIEDVRKEVEGRLGHQLAPAPIPGDEVEAAEILRQLERIRVNQDSEAEVLLKSVGFFTGSSADELDAMAVNSGTEDDEPDPGEELFSEPDVDDGIESY